jgi:hypothetical protein
MQPTRSTLPKLIRPPSGDERPTRSTTMTESPDLPANSGGTCRAVAKSR